MHCLRSDVPAGYGYLRIALRLVFSLGDERAPSIPTGCDRGNNDAVDLESARRNILCGDNRQGSGDWQSGDGDNIAQTCALMSSVVNEKLRRGPSSRAALPGLTNRGYNVIIQMLEFAILCLAIRKTWDERVLNRLLETACEALRGCAVYSGSLTPPISRQMTGAPCNRRVQDRVNSHAVSRKRQRIPVQRPLG
jgi:hypothetical protein